MGIKVSGSGGSVSSVAVLSADMTAISAQTTLQNVTGLGLAIGASATEIWRVTYWLLTTAANTTMDLKLGFTVPASCTMKWATFGLNSEIPSWATRGASNTPNAILAESGTTSPATLGGTQGTTITALVFGGGTAGTVQLQYAQNTSDAGNLQVLKGSMMEAIRVAA
jgi:hypothetical protein